MEYVKGWALVHMLASAHGPGLWPGVEASWDLSLGYDLAGIRSPKVRAFVQSLRDAQPLIEALRAELPDRLARWREVEVPADIAHSVTLSTFHGCPAQEIEAIAAQTLDWGLHTVVKLNPTLHGYRRCRELLDRLGYDFIQLDPRHFEGDLQWSQLADFVPRLKARAAALGLHFGVKFTNTLISASPEAPFSEDTVYTSGAPLHVLAYLLAARFRAEIDPELPITFSAGVNASNFWECVASGLGPVTACSDLLKGGGYARQLRYLRGLEGAMAERGVEDIAALRASCRELLAERAAGLLEDRRWHREANCRPPRKIDSRLSLLDCLTCDKCVPVCPNAANFTFPVPRGTHRPGRAIWTEGALRVEPGPPLVIERRHQIGNTAEACNLCGQCDVFCPEYDGPYLVKPTLFLSGASYRDHPGRDGFLIDGGALIWRRLGLEYRYRPEGERARLLLDGGSLLLEGDRPVAAEGSGELDLRIAVTMRLLLAALSSPESPTWLPARAGLQSPTSSGCCST